MIVNPDVESWMAQVMPSPGPILEEMNQSGVERGFPIVGPLVGAMLEQYARAIGAKRIFEMGSGFGYSTAWFSRAKPDLIVHCDGSPDLSAEAKEWMAKLGVDCVRFEVGDARDVLRGEDGEFDIVFNDIDKDGYPEAWDIASEKVRVGGLIITDNTLWSARVVEETDDEWTQAIQEYVRKAMGDERFVTVIQPTRDGVAVSLRIA